MDKYKRLSDDDIVANVRDLSKMGSVSSNS